MAPRTISAGEFKARCLKIMDEVKARHIEVVITKRGKPVAKLVPADDEIPDAFGSMQGTVRYHGDIVAPDLESWGEA
jgi:prevent-host-death family protein